MHSPPSTLLDAKKKKKKKKIKKRKKKKKKKRYSRKSKLLNRQKHICNGYILPALKYIAFQNYSLIL